MTGQFATRQFVLTYKPGTEYAYNQSMFYDTLQNVLSKMFGTGYRLTGRLCYIQVSIYCCYFELNDALAREFRKHPNLKGMQFRLDLRERLARV